MSKAWLVCSLLGVASLGVIDATINRHNPEFRFLDGAQSVLNTDIVLRPHRPAHLETFNLHVPFDEAWSTAESELCDQKGWSLGDHSSELQNFNLHDKRTVSLIRGKVDSHQDFIPGTEGTDTYVEVRTKD